MSDVGTEAMHSGLSRSRCFAEVLFAEIDLQFWFVTFANPFIDSVN